MLAWACKHNDADGQDKRDAEENEKYGGRAFLIFCESPADYEREETSWSPCHGPSVCLLFVEYDVHTAQYINRIGPHSTSEA